MAKAVTYRGPERPSLVRHTYSIRNRGKTYRLFQDQPVVVPDEVASKLAQVAGHTFDISNKEG